MSEQKSDCLAQEMDVCEWEWTNQWSEWTVMPIVRQRKWEKNQQVIGLEIY